MLPPGSSCVGCRTICMGWTKNPADKLILGAPGCQARTCCCALRSGNVSPHDQASCRKHGPAMPCRSAVKRQTMLAAVVRLQSLWRGRQQRRSFLRLCTAACTIQVLSYTCVVTLSMPIPWR